MSRVFGSNAVSELLSAAPASVRVLFIAQGRARSGDELLIERARELGIEVREIDMDSLKRRSGGRGGARIAAEIALAPPVDLADLNGDRDPAPLVVALDGVTDPHNLGAIVRSAAAFGADAVLLTRDRAAPLNDAAVRASAGAVAHVPVLRVTNLARALRQLRKQGLWAVASTAEADQSLYEVDLRLPTVIVMGAEGQGVRPGVIKACEVVAGLELPGPVGSLNVSAFTAVALAEAARQRRGIYGDQGH